MTEKIFFRQSITDDIEEIVKLRRIMFESMGYSDNELLNQADEAVRRYFLKSLASGEFIRWMAENSKKQVIGMIGVVFDVHPPGPNNLSGRKGYIMNLVVIQEYRKQWIGEQLMHILLNWLQEHQITVADLHATDMGQRLYQKLGFKFGNEMSLEVGKPI